MPGQERDARLALDVPGIHAFFSVTLYDKTWMAGQARP
jgi:hypothetical protein